MKDERQFQEVLDSVFKRDDVRGKWGPELDGEFAFHLGRAFVSLLQRSPGANASAPPRIVVGRDMRIGSPEVAAQLIQGIHAAGGVVEDLGQCGTELIYYVTGQYPERYQGGAMVTASHNPPEDAGVKFVRSQAAPLHKDDLKELKSETARLYALHLPDALRRPERSDKDALRGPERSDKIAGFVSKLLDVAGLSEARPEPVPLKIVVEAGNGMGGVMFRPLAEQLEPRLPGIQFVFSNETPDGQMPVGTPDPLLPEYLELLAGRVRAESADLGICFDGDADRAGFVDDTGAPIDASLVSIILFEMLQQTQPERGYVMGNLNTSLRFMDFVERTPHWSEGFVMTPVGHAQIKALMRVPPYQQAGKSHVLFASEHSGHFFYSDFYYADSGMTTALFAIRKAWNVRARGETLFGNLDSQRQAFYASGEINQQVDSDDVVKEKIRQAFQEYVTGHRPWRGIVAGQQPGTNEVRPFTADVQYDPATLKALDLRIDSAKGEKPRWWFSLRKSGNEPKLRLNVESDDEGRMQELRDQLLELIRARPARR